MSKTLLLAIFISLTTSCATETTTPVDADTDETNLTKVDCSNSAQMYYARFQGGREAYTYRVGIAGNLANAKQHAQTQANREAGTTATLLTSYCYNK